MVKLTEQSTKSGVFSVSLDQEANGNLTLEGSNTRLSLWSDHPLTIDTTRTITGELEDLTKVSLIGCITTFDGHVGKGQRIRYKYTLAPRQVILGSSHVSEHECAIHCVTFVLEHAVSLFDDAEAYGVIFNNAEAVGDLAKIDNSSISAPTGDWNWISYYTGKKAVFDVATAIGQVSAMHSPTFSAGVADNHGLIKGTDLGIRFEEALPVMDALFRMGRVLQFVDLVVGHRQNVIEILLDTDPDDPLQTAEVYAPGYAQQLLTSSGSEPQLHCTLIHPTENSSEFADVLCSWLERDSNWREARLRLSQDWGERVYNYDRMIAAANVFDLLPNDIYGCPLSLSSELCQAVDHTKQTFKILPKSDVRDDVLGYMGRVGGWRLKQKIIRRARGICDSIGHALPEFESVIKEAVNLRNHYVHGSSSRIKSGHRLQLLRFLTDALEFVFFASDLLDAGWNISEWCKTGSPRGHPFHDFLVDYKADVARLNAALK